jgi:general secretion pathway protein G
MQSWLDSCKLSDPDLRAEPVGSEQRSCRKERERVQSKLMPSGKFLLESCNLVDAKRSHKHRPGTSISTKPRGPRPLGKQRGFTLVELLIVCAVLMTISAIAIPSLLSAMDAARIARAVGDMEAIESGVTLYQVIYGEPPDDLTQVGYGGLLDPWRTPYQYLNHATMKGNGKARKDRFLVPLNDDYDLYSMGKDGKSVSPITAKPSQDDIIRAGSGDYLGLASQF